MIFPGISFRIRLCKYHEDGSTIEVATVGNEGMVGIPAILTVDKIPYQVMWPQR